MKKVVFDIETKNTFAQVGSNNPADLSISLVGIHDSETNTYETFLEEEFSKLWNILEKTDVLIGFNSNHFDLPLLNKYYPGNLEVIKSVDLMAEIRASLGRRVGLNAVAEATIGSQKNGDGLQAITWWEQGEIEKIKKYCLLDVRITKDIYDYARLNNSVKVKDRTTGETITVPLETSSWEQSRDGGMTHSLPF